MAEKSNETKTNEPAVKLPKGLTIDWAKKTFGDEQGTKFYHDTARNYGFGDFRQETYHDGPPALDLNGLSDKDFAALEKKAAELKQ